jgi:enterochelin esterase-like enzyme
MKKNLLLLFALIMCFHVKLLSQGINLQSITSSILKQDVAYNVYFPPSYNQDKTKKFPVLYLLHGFSGNQSDWTVHGMSFTMDSVINNGAKEMIVIMPDGMDSFYCNNYDDRKLHYEDFMVKELIPQVESKYRIISSRGSRAIAGLSMGGYGATYHAFKYRDMYSSGYSMSGALTVGNTPDIMAMLDTLTAEQLHSLPAYTMEIGLQDISCYFVNFSFHNFLISKHVTHTYIERAGVHDWLFWTICLPKAIRFASDNFDNIPTGVTSVYEFKDKVYPNPATEWIHVKAGSAKFATLCNMDGAILEKKAIANSEAVFYVGDLAKGFYLVNIGHNNGSESYKIVKN